jgi:hypothetical protein
MDCYFLFYLYVFRNSDQDKQKFRLFKQHQAISAAREEELMKHVVAANVS